MRTVLERLKPEARKQLDRRDKILPGMGQFIKNMLMKWTHTGDVSLSDAINITYFCSKEEQLFNPVLFFALFND